VDAARGAEGVTGAVRNDHPGLKVIFITPSGEFEMRNVEGTREVILDTARILRAKVFITHPHDGRLCVYDTPTPWGRSKPVKTFPPEQADGALMWALMRAGRSG
jgi:hypothetical protein